MLSHTVRSVITVLSSLRLSDPLKEIWYIFNCI